MAGNPVKTFRGRLFDRFLNGVERVGNARIGTVIATMLPYTIAFFLVWTLLLVGWLLLRPDLGPGAGIYYELPG